MEIQKNGLQYNRLFDRFGKCDGFVEVLSNVERDDLSQAYEIAHSINQTQMSRELTMYLIKEHGNPFKYNPLTRLEYVPSYYLYEADDKELEVYVNDGIKEIKEYAFAYCSIKKVVIPKSVELLGDNSLCLNDGEIFYEGTKEEFIAKFLGKTKCFYRSHREEIVNCVDGALIVRP